MIESQDALAVLRAVTPGSRPSPELAEALVSLALQDARGSTTRPELAKLGPGGHVGAASRFRWLLERQTAPAFEAVLAAADKAVGEHLAAQDLSGDTVAIPSASCIIIGRPDDLIAESNQPTIVNEKHPLVAVLRRQRHVIIDPRVLPEGHPLRDIPPADMQLERGRMPALFVGEPVSSRNTFYPCCSASITETRIATAFMREAAEAMKARKAEERRKWEERRVKEQADHEAAVAVARKLSMDITAADVAVEMDELKKQVATLVEANKLLLKDSIADADANMLRLEQGIADEQAKEAAEAAPTPAETPA